MTETVAVDKEKLKWVGKSVVRKDGAGKVTGETKFFSDMSFPKMLYAKAARSKYPHALIKKISTEKAEAVPGVVAVLTHKDVPGFNGFGIVVPDQPVLCQDKVRYLGDAVAVIAAENLEAAERAAQLVEVEYEPLPVVSDPVEAMEPGAPKVHEKGNILRHETVREEMLIEHSAKPLWLSRILTALGGKCTCFLRLRPGSVCSMMKETLSST